MITGLCTNCPLFVGDVCSEAVKSTGSNKAINGQYVVHTDMEWPGRFYRDGDTFNCISCPKVKDGKQTFMNADLGQYTNKEKRELVLKWVNRLSERVLGEGMQLPVEALDVIDTVQDYLLGGATKQEVNYAKKQAWDLLRNSDNTSELYSLWLESVWVLCWENPTPALAFCITQECWLNGVGVRTQVLQSLHSLLPFPKFLLNSNRAIL